MCPLHSGRHEEALQKYELDSEVAEESLESNVRGASAEAIERINGVNQGMYVCIPPYVYEIPLLTVVFDGLDIEGHVQSLSDDNLANIELDDVGRVWDAMFEAFRRQEQLIDDIL